MRKIIKYTLRFVLLLILLLVVAALVVQLPFVQKKLTGTLENYLQEKLQTEVSIESIRLKLPKSLSLQKVFIEDLQRDTFISVEALDVNFALNQLFSKKIQINDVTLINGAANIHIWADSSNYDFIVDAFAAPSEAPTPTEEQAAATDWLVTFAEANLSLKNIRFGLVEENQGLELATYLGDAHALVDQIDYVNHLYEVQKINIADSWIRVKMDTITPTTTATEPAASNYWVKADELTFRNIALELLQPDLEFTTQIGELTHRAGFFKMKKDSIWVQSQHFKITESDLKYDVPNAPTQAGFDPNHFHFRDIHLELKDFDYNNLNIKAEIVSATIKEKNDFELKGLQAQFEFSENHTLLQNFALKTQHTNIRSELTQIEFPFFATATTPIEQLKIQATINAKANNLKDLKYFYPPLENSNFSALPLASPLRLNAHLNGSLRELTIHQLNFDGLQSKFLVNGKIKNLTQPERMYLDLKNLRVATRGTIISSFLPDSTLPVFVQLPDSISLIGNVTGHLQNIQTKFFATSHRQNAPAPSRLQAQAVIKNISNLDRTYLDIQLDTFYTSKNELLAYLPEATIPPYVQLPDEIILSGNVNGLLADLSSNFQLATVRNQNTNQLKVLGKISNLFVSPNPSFDIRLDASNISRQELAAYLPDSLLPAYFQLPFVRELKGIFKGDLEDFKTNFNLMSNTGEWSVNASLTKEKYQLEMTVAGFQPEEFFEKNYLDSLMGFGIQPLRIEAALSGEGFDFKYSTFANVLLNIKNAADTSLAGLTIKGKLAQQKFRVEAVAAEKAIQLQSTIDLDYTQNIPRWMVDLNLDELDLLELKLSDTPLAIQGKLMADIKGMNLDTLSGKALLSDVVVQYNDQSEKIDSLQIDANLDLGKNNITITSDFLDANLNGNFNFSQLPNILQQYIYKITDSQTSDDLVGNSEDNFNVTIQLHRPEFLTLGWITGLEELSPLTTQGDFDNAKATWNFKSSIPFVHYQNMRFENSRLSLAAKDEVVNYEFGFEKSDIQGVAYVENFKTYGSLADQILNNTFEILDKKNKKRFEIQSQLAFLSNQSFKFSLGKNQLLNYKKWEVQENNSIELGNQTIAINDWRLFRNVQSIVIRDLGSEQLELQFAKFNLKTISEILKLNGNYLGGILNGRLNVNDLFHQVYFNSDLTIDSLLVFDAQLGNLSLRAQNESTKLINAEATLRGNGNDISLAGQYNLKNATNPLNFNLEIPRLDLTTIEPLTFGFLEKIKGQLRGQVRIEGSLDYPALLGQIRMDSTAFDVALLQARLRLSNQPIAFDANVIEFKNLEIFDADNNKGVISSFLITENYRDFSLNSELEIQDFLVLNTKPADNELYYGKLLVDAKAKISGNLEEPIIEIEAKPQKNSNLTYVYNPYSAEIESHKGIVEFIQPEKKDTLTIDNEKVASVSESLNMKIVVKIAVDDDLNFKAITDPLTGDNFEGKMKGDLVYVQLPDGSMELSGSLEVVAGTYLFTYQNVIRRPFEVKPGGTIVWTGDPLNPQLDIDVEYKVRASTYALMATQGTGQPASGKEIFVVNLNIGGVPTQTDISTSITYPRTDGNSNNQDIQTAINQINQDPSQQNTQAFALILFNGFIAQGVGQGEFQLVDISGGINSAITNQLNNLANRYIKFVELDFGIDSYENSNENAQTDFKISVRKRLLNDRLTISLDGKTTTETGTDESSSQSYLDNVTVEYSLTPSGRFKIKIYNKRDFDDFIQGTGVKVGSALVFSKEFNEIRLFGR
ncbi:MAG: hypothetical protein AAF573_06870 [Bacteroidota bacterium]